MVCAALLLWLICGLIAPALAAGPASDQRPLGVWINDKATVAVRIVPCGADLCGRITWLAHPYDHTGILKRDRHNPDPAKRQRPLCGLQVLSGFRHTADQVWSKGVIYDARQGNTYHGSITRTAPDEIQVRAYILLPLFGKTQIWTRTQRPGGVCPQQPEERSAQVG